MLPACVNGWDALYTRRAEVANVVMCKILIVIRQLLSLFMLTANVEFGCHGK